jgi:hypothetical protein
VAYLVLNRRKTVKEKKFHFRGTPKQLRAFLQYVRSVWGDKRRIIDMPTVRCQ